MREGSRWIMCGRGKEPPRVSANGRIRGEKEIRKNKVKEEKELRCGGKRNGRGETMPKRLIRTSWVGPSSQTWLERQKERQKKQLPSCRVRKIEALRDWSIMKNKIKIFWEISHGGIDPRST